MMTTTRDDLIDRLHAQAGSRGWADGRLELGCDYLVRITDPREESGHPLARRAESVGLDRDGLIILDDGRTSGLYDLPGLVAALEATAPDELHGDEGDMETVWRAIRTARAEIGDLED